MDNCPNHYNPLQEDDDDDGAGDAGSISISRMNGSWISARLVGGCGTMS